MKIVHTVTTLSELRCTVGTYVDLRYHRKGLRKSSIPLTIETKGCVLTKGSRTHKPTKRTVGHKIMTKANMCCAIFSCNAVTDYFMGPKKGRNSALDKALHILSWLMGERMLSDANQRKWKQEKLPSLSQRTRHFKATEGGVIYSGVTQGHHYEHCVLVKFAVFCFFLKFIK